MVDFDVVRERLLKGAYVGVGSFVSSYTATTIEEQLGLGDIGASAGQVVTGLGISVGVDEVFDDPNSMPNDAVEYAGYGIQGAGFSNLAESIRAGSNTGADVVRVERKGSTQTAQTVTDGGTQEEEGEEAFSIDV